MNDRPIFPVGNAVSVASLSLTWAATVAVLTPAMAAERALGGRFQNSNLEWTRINTNPEKENFRDLFAFIRVHSRFKTSTSGFSNSPGATVRYGGFVSEGSSSCIVRKCYIQDPSAFCLPDALNILHIEPNLPKCVNMNAQPLFTMK